MDAVIELIIKHSDSFQETYDKVIPALKKLEKATSSSSASSSSSTSTSTSTSATTKKVSVNVLETSTKNGLDPLNELLPEKHAVGYLFILNARLGANDCDLSALLGSITNFTEKFNIEQLRMIPEQVNYFVKQFVGLASSVGLHAASLQPLKNLIQRYPPPGVLTSMHTLFVQVAMECKVYGITRDVLLQDIDDIDVQIFPLKYQDHLLYHYLGGTIMALLGETTRSIEMLEICVSAPGSGVSAVQIDAYKKLVLVQLLTHGKTSSIPKYTSSSASSAYKNSAGVYNEYATAYASRNTQHMQTIVERNQEVFEKDFNTGLIYQCNRAFRRRTIQNLTEVYITLSLSEIVIAMELPLTEDNYREAEYEVAYLLSTGKIHGSISHPPLSSSTSDPASPPSIDYRLVTVSFSDDPEPYNSLETVARLKRAIDRVQKREERLISIDNGLSVNKDFVSKAYFAAASAQSTMGTGLGGIGGLDDLDSMTPDWDGEA